MLDLLTNSPACYNCATYAPTHSKQYDFIQYLISYIMYYCSTPSTMSPYKCTVIAIQLLYNTIHLHVASFNRHTHTHTHRVTHKHTHTTAYMPPYRITRKKTQCNPARNAILSMHTSPSNLLHLPTNKHFASIHPSADDNSCTLGTLHTLVQYFSKKSVRYGDACCLYGNLDPLKTSAPVFVPLLSCAHTLSYCTHTL